MARNPAGYLFGIIQKAFRGEFRAWAGQGDAPPCPVRHPLCQRPPVRRLHRLTSRACARCWSGHDGGTSRDPQGMVATGSLPIDTHRPQKRLPDACPCIRC